MVFDGVEIVKKPVSQPVTSTKQNKPSFSWTKASATSIPLWSNSGKEKEVPPAHPIVAQTPETLVEPKSTTTSAASTSTPPVHPFAKAKDVNYLLPVNCNFVATLKPKEKDAAYHIILLLLYRMPSLSTQS